MKPRSSVYYTTLSSKGQITFPEYVVAKLGLKPGAKIDIYPLAKEEFVARVRRRSRILEFAGDLKHLDARGPEPGKEGSRR